MTPPTRDDEPLGRTSYASMLAAPGGPGMGEDQMAYRTDGMIAVGRSLRSMMSFPLRDDCDHVVTACTARSTF